MGGLRKGSQELTIKYTLGIPSNETIQGHPYNKLGMMPYSFYELRNSDLIERLQEVEKNTSLLQF